jgi:hypothetical protein
MRKQGAQRKQIDPMAWVAKRTTLAPDQQRDLGLAYHISLQAMLCGSGTEQAWSTLSCTLNIALILCEQGICAGGIETVKLSQAAMMRSKERAARTGKWAFDGEGIRIIQAALNLHDKQTSRATRGQITEALREVHRRIETDEVMA